jgi:hypothetical protein
MRFSAACDFRWFRESDTSSFVTFLRGLCRSIVVFLTKFSCSEFLQRGSTARECSGNDVMAFGRDAVALGTRDSRNQPVRAIQAQQPGHAPGEPATRRDVGWFVGRQRATQIAGPLGSWWSLCVAVGA